MKGKYETVLSCELCGRRKSKLIDEKGHIVQCRSCGLKFVNPRPAQKDISVSYDHSYESCWSEIKPEQQLIYDKKVNFVQQFIRGGKILDVGAGRGELLSALRRTGAWECFGTETSQFAVDFVKREFDITLSLGQLEDLAYPENSFDAISFWHVLEHLPHPAKAIKEARRILRDGGFLFIAVPNDSWLGRKHFFKNAFKKAVNRLPLKRKLKLKKMYPEVGEEGNKHLFYFTPRTLAKLLKKYGFQIKKYSVDYNYENPGPKIERKYSFDLLFCRLTGINLSNAVLIAAQK